MAHALSRMQAPLRALFILALVVSFVVALLPAPDALDLSHGRDKVGHFAAFLALALIGYAGWPNRLLAVTMTLLAYGVAMELAQSFTTWRQDDLGDFMADAAGVLAALLLHAGWRFARR